MPFNDKVFALRAMVARHAYKDERIKPFFNALIHNLNDYEFLNAGKNVKAALTNTLEAINSGLCGPEYKLEN